VYIAAGGTICSWIEFEPLINFTIVSGALHALRASATEDDLSYALVYASVATSALTNEPTNQW
jgi:hypothetical protein